MKTLHIKATLTEDKTLVLSDLPFKAGETVQVVIRNRFEANPLLPSRTRSAASWIGTQSRSSRSRLTSEAPSGSGIEDMHMNLRTVLPFMIALAGGIVLCGRSWSHAQTSAETAKEHFFLLKFRVENALTQTVRVRADDTFYVSTSIADNEWTIRGKTHANRDGETMNVQFGVARQVSRPLALRVARSLNQSLSETRRVPIGGDELEVKQPQSSAGAMTSWDVPTLHISVQRWESTGDPLDALDTASSAVTSSRRETDKLNSGTSDR
jgi:hypothetical protein